MAGKDAKEDDAIWAHLNDLRDAGVGIVVSDDHEVALLEVDARTGVADVGVGEARCVHAMEVDPKVPRRRRYFAHG